MQGFRIRDLPHITRHTFYYDLRAAVLFGVFGGFFFPFVAIVGRKIGATDLQVALIVSAPYIANAFALLWTEDVLGVGRVWYVVWPSAAGRALLAGMFFILSPWYYTALIFVYMLITAIPFPSYASIMKTNYPDGVRGRLMSYVRVGNAVFWIIASAAGGWYLDKDTGNYKYLFPAAAVFGVLSAFQFNYIKTRRDKAVKEKFRAITHLAVPLMDGRFLRFLAVYSVFEFGLLLATPVYPLILVDDVHITNFATGVFGSLFSAAWLAGFFFWGHFIDRSSARRTLTLAFLVSCAMPALYLVSRNIFVLGAAQCAAGFLFAAIELVGYVLITRMARPADVPRYMAAHIAFGGLRGATAPFIGTSLYAAAGPDLIFGSSLVLALLSITLALRLLESGPS